MRVGVVDIGTNSMRLLITDGTHDVYREAVVTGLGRGVDKTRELGRAEMEKTIQVLAAFGRRMTDANVSARGAVATSATRDATNRSLFVQRATEALGVEPMVIDGPEEGRLAYTGAVSDLASDGWLVTDIGGGSTEFTTLSESLSVDIGSIRLSDRILDGRPPVSSQMEQAREHVLDLFAAVTPGEGHSLVGVAGTWTTLAIMALEIGSYSPGDTHRRTVTSDRLQILTDELSHLTVLETVSNHPGIDPARAPMILAGAVIAGCIMQSLGAESVLISERDSLDGLAHRLLALA